MVKAPHNMNYTELLDEIIERRAYDDVLEPILIELGERVEMLENRAEIAYVGEEEALHDTGR